MRICIPNPQIFLVATVDRGELCAERRKLSLVNAKDAIILGREPRIDRCDMSFETFASVICILFA